MVNYKAQLSPFYQRLVFNPENNLEQKLNGYNYEQATTIWFVNINNDCYNCMVCIIKSTSSVLTKKQDSVKTEDWWSKILLKLKIDEARFCYNWRLMKQNSVKTEDWFHYKYTDTNPISNHLIYRETLQYKAFPHIS